MKKVLVIEDRVNTRKLFVECLKAKGFSTIDAENGLIGVQLIQEQSPDLVICDIAMPKLDGYDVLTTLRTNPATATIPLIFVTGKGTEADFRRGMEMGADDYLSKRCTVDQLLKAVAVRLEKQTALQQQYTAEYQIVSEVLQTDTASIASDQSIFPSIPLLSDVFEFIEANYHRSITLNNVAQAVGYSPAYLTNLVGQQTGKTLYSWIIERRMAEARCLLLNTNQAVNQIAAKLGYQNASSFTRQFCQFHGVSPQAWRTQNSRKGLPRCIEPRYV